MTNAVLDRGAGRATGRSERGLRSWVKWAPDLVIATPHAHVPRSDQGAGPHLQGFRSFPPRTETYVFARARAPRVPVLKVARGQQRSLTSPVAGYPQFSISAVQTLDRRPIFQAGHAGSIPVARSAPLGHGDHRTGRARAPKQPRRRPR